MVWKCSFALYIYVYSWEHICIMCRNGLPSISLRHANKCTTDFILGVEQPKTQTTPHA